MGDDADIRAAVIGAGYLGRFHAQKWAGLPGCRLVAIADPNPEVRARVGAELGVNAVADWQQLLGSVDAVSIATPTPLHHPIARSCLSAGVHVLVEKPITMTVSEARDLIRTAAGAQRMLQVGHLERFNAAVQAIEGIVTRPRFIESHRLAPFRQRGTDVSVVLDVMIHDIDLIQSIVRSPLVAVDAIGTSVFSDELDIANARLRFASGCVANVTASRVSMKTERKLRLFQDDLYLSLDLQQKIVTVIRKGTGPADGDMPQVAIEERTYEQGDALKCEIEAFADSIRTGRPPLVDGEAGLEALETAIRIAALVQGGAAAR
ncbi:MAG TPA: Gfo/Idh/MocA family oxidoreductase [Steroidobacteraceae bacterium]|nr:Gfo/Idh/MocA family oxidoreductase [Steroidobacteraceae bacterium]